MSPLRVQHSQTGKTGVSHTVTRIQDKAVKRSIGNGLGLKADRDIIAARKVMSCCTEQLVWGQAETKVLKRETLDGRRGLGLWQVKVKRTEQSSAVLAKRE